MCVLRLSNLITIAGKNVELVGYKGLECHVLCATSRQLCDKDTLLTGIMLANMSTDV